ncbi:uncharacterized protein LOC132634401 [Lycium barbarum]|uniref:uncharacterized protein LOC132634401 n=1 Tax=Lycium barbarum TaxID=112863 RepID=UPI00293EEE33|nr:uncharacterized protein LOC132634401 [Lycium barbarum]
MEPPERGFYKLNTDEAFDTKTGIGGIGGIIRNSSGNWIIRLTKGLPNSSVIHAELTTLMRGLKLAFEHKLFLLEVECDSTEVVNILKHGHDTYTPMFLECRCFIELMGRPARGHGYREQNSVADALAKEGVKKKLFGEKKILVVPPIYAAASFWADMEGTTYARYFCNNVIASNEHYRDNLLDVFVIATIDTHVLDGTDWSIAPEEAQVK